MDLQCLHLEPARAFHFGQRGVGVEASTDFAPSDTIFSALCSTLRIADSAAALTRLLDRFAQGAPPFLISCGFPYVLCRGEPLRFYPTPLSWAQHPRGDDRRKARWMSESILLGEIGVTGRADRRYVEDIEALVTPAELDALRQDYAELARRSGGGLPLWTVDDVPRVAVDRVTSASAVYRAGCLTFTPGGGIWVGVAPLDTQWVQGTLPALLDLLGEQGLGGERSSGYGAFSHRRALDTPLMLPDIHPGDRFMTLSYYAPDLSAGERAAFAPDCAYAVEMRRGWMSSPDNDRLRRKAVRMLRFGSVLRAFDGRALYGRLVDVAPDEFKTQPNRHPVWRCGLALPIRLKD
ncbi:MAG: hypothetical protein L6Q98_15445 [Anaerolineae bacterium]|nr:hypothetical protein [Anaerolineae bacterium]NUQ04764.1 hypothetical protein [Anaerolineae bacterium]